MATFTQTTAAHPPNRPDHGISESTACTLWAGDVDATNTSEYEASIDADDPELCVIAPATDIPLDTPPVAVEQWNSQDHRNFRGTGPDRSRYPEGASLTDGRFVRDAYVETFAIQPSTRTHLSPTERPLYVASNGTITGTVDYRVVLPGDDSTGDRREYWRLAGHTIEETHLAIDGRRAAIGPGRHRPTFTFDLGGIAGSRHTVELGATIDVDVTRRIEVCAKKTNGTCDRWHVRRERFSDSVTVRDSLDVVEYDLTVAGYRTRYPDGDLGLLVFKNLPWLGYSVPGGKARGVWRFYVARNEQWDTLVTSTETGIRRGHSPLHSLQVHAFPVETGPTPEPSRTVTILDVTGVSTHPPTLPAEVLLDVVAAPYTASYGIATRTETTDHDLEEVTAVGLVRGVDADVTRSGLSEVQTVRSNLTVEVINRTSDEVSVRLRLTEAHSGTPIGTDGRLGFIVVEGQRLNTSANGTVTTTVARPDGALSARYQPAQWWKHSRAYVGASDVVTLASGEFVLVSILFEVGVPLSLFLGAAFMIDRMTGWHLWPPWRRL